MTDLELAARIANLGQDDQADERTFLRQWREEQAQDYDQAAEDRRIAFDMSYEGSREFQEDIGS